jgi:quinol monooxygenase YgiN
MPQTWYFQSEWYVAAMIVITGSVQISPEHRDAALALGIEHSRRSRAEPGCLAHNCHVDAEDLHRIVFLEEWTDMDAVKQHFAVRASGEFVRALTAMAIATPEIKLLDAREIKR